jgi:hypothetical protein
MAWIGAGALVSFVACRAAVQTATSGMQVARLGGSYVHHRSTTLAVVQRCTKCAQCATNSFPASRSRFPVTRTASGRTTDVVVDGQDARSWLRFASNWFSRLSLRTLQAAGDTTHT